jgi:N utilization substance protein A
MINQELVRLVDSIARDRNIEKELVFDDLESAMATAARKHFGADEDELTVEIDRLSGEISAVLDGEPLDMKTLGRIAAQTAKQVMIQKFREAERGSIFDEYSTRVGEIITGTVSRFEGGSLVVSLGRAEGFLPRSEQIPGENPHPGERIRAMILDVRELTHQVKIILSRTHPDYIRRLFELEVPEVAERVIELKALAREAGYRTKVAVSSIDVKVDAVGACVGVRGSRIRNIVDELGGEKIDIVRWNESSQILIGNALKPAEVQEIALCFELGRATVVVNDDQLSLAIGKRGQNVRLAARLTGWDIDILTPVEYNKNLDIMEKCLREFSYVDDVVLDKVLAMGIVSVGDVEEVGEDPLVSEVGLTEEQAKEIVEKASIEAKRIAEIAAREKEEAAAKKASEAKAGESADGATPSGDEDSSASEAEDSESEETEAVESVAVESVAVESVAVDEGETPAGEVGSVEQVESSGPEAAEPAGDSPVEGDADSETPPGGFSESPEPESAGVPMTSAEDLSIAGQESGSDDDSSTASADDADPLVKLDEEGVASNEKQ